MTVCVFSSNPLWICNFQTTKNGVRNRVNNKWLHVVHWNILESNSLNKLQWSETTTYSLDDRNLDRLVYGANLFWISQDFCAGTFHCWCAIRVERIRHLHIRCCRNDIIHALYIVNNAESQQVKGSISICNRPDALEMTCHKERNFPHIGFPRISIFFFPSYVPL